MAISDNLKPALLAGAFGLAGTLIPAIIAWVHDRDIHTTRLRKLDEAMKRVKFWDQWLKLSVQIADPAEAESLKRIEKELTLLGHVLESDSLDFHELLAQQRAAATEYKQVRRSLPFWRRWLLLYVPQRSLAWFPRVLFWIAIPAFVLISLVGTDLRTDPYTLIGSLGTDLLLLVWMIVFRALSSWLEQPHGTHVSLADCPPPRTPPPAAK